MRVRSIFIVAFFVLLNSCGSYKKLNRDLVRFSVEDEKIFTDVQRTTFRYFWEGAEPNSGLARERFHVDNVYPENDKMIITSGGSGFGVMAILVGIERGFIFLEPYWH